jgi:hypothetical protein
MPGAENLWKGRMQTSSAYFALNLAVTGHASVWLSQTLAYPFIHLF